MECAGQRSHWPGAAPKPDKKLASIRNLVGARSKYSPLGRHSHRHPRSSQPRMEKCVPWTILYHLSLDKSYYLGQSFHNKTTIVRQIFWTQLERISEDEKEKLSQPWSEQPSFAPIDHQGPGPGQGWARLTARQESRWLLYGNFGFNIQSRSRVPESEKCVITSIRSAEPSCGFLQVQSFCIGSGCNCTDHLRLLPSIAKCKM